MSDETEREFAAFERGLILGCALGNGARLTTQEIADLLGYHGLRRGYNGAFMAMNRARVSGLTQGDDGRWELCIPGDEI